MGTLDEIRNKFNGTTGLDGTDAFDKATDISVDFTKNAADSMAADTTANTRFWTNPFDFRLSVISGKISPGGTLTAHDTNNATISVKTDDAAAGTPASALDWVTSTTGTGNWATSVAKNHTTRTSGNATLVEGANLWWGIAKGGTGVVVPAFVATMRLRRLGG